MSIDLNKASEIFDKLIKNLTPEDIEKYFPPDNTPKGWVSIEEHLPMCTVDDFVEKGYSIYKVKDKHGNEFQSTVTDHNIWYYRAKEQGVTHWWNE